MTPTQLKEIKGEFEEKFVRTTILGRDEGTVMFRDLLSGEVWQWFESKLGEVEEESVDDFANALAIEMTKPSPLAGGLEGMYRLFADFVMVFSRDYLKSNKLDK